MELITGIDSVCDYSDTYILIKRILTDVEDTAALADKNNNQIKFKFCAPFPDSISKQYNNMTKKTLM